MKRICETCSRLRWCKILYPDSWKGRSEDDPDCIHKPSKYKKEQSDNDETSNSECLTFDEKAKRLSSSVIPQDDIEKGVRGAATLFDDEEDEIPF